MNGMWENDFIGNTMQEQKLWATCFANEVTALRRATGEHFLIDWNPNACVENIPYARYYPGNGYVDIVGLDLFDESCVAPKTPYTFSQLANEPASLTTFEAFAAAKGKPMSLPEWALSATPIRDDPAYVNGIGSTVAYKDFAFENYFDFQQPSPLLGSQTPLSLAAFQNWFGSAIPKRQLK
jgi:beta-mannanase